MSSFASAATFSLRGFSDSLTVLDRRALPTVLYCVPTNPGPPLLLCPARALVPLRANLQPMFDCSKRESHELPELRTQTDMTDIP